LKEKPAIFVEIFVQNSVYRIIGTGKSGAGVARVDHPNLNLRKAVYTLSKIEKHPFLEKMESIQQQKRISCVIHPKHLY